MPSWKPKQTFLGYLWRQHVALPIIGADRPLLALSSGANPHFEA
jgi:hypothetical protein